MGLSYRQGDWSISGNVGQAKENLHGAIIDDITTKAFGTKISYKVTPRISVSGTYGQKPPIKIPSPTNAWIYQISSHNEGGNISSRVHESWFLIKPNKNLWSECKLLYLWRHIDFCFDEPNTHHQLYRRRCV